jgi:uncharacterized protein DUF3854
MNFTQLAESQLTARHLAQLREGSGLSDETIVRARLRSVDNWDYIGSSLNMTYHRDAARFGPTLEIPFPDLNGNASGFSRFKPSNPRRDKNGKRIRYEQPKGTPLRAFLAPGIVNALKVPKLTIGFTEGEKKALAADQAGRPCIGLTGVFSWQKKRTDKQAERELIDDLAQIDWEGRTVWICFDTDDERKPSVNHARAELARILEAHGARVVFVELPVVRDESGNVVKMGVDDFIVRCGDGGLAFRDLVDKALAPSTAPTTLEKYRDGMVRSRVESVGRPGLYIDVSPTGSGKSHSDTAAIQRVDRSLTILPSHKLCEETVLLYAKNDIVAAAFPKLSEETCHRFDDAEKAMRWGLSPSSALCPHCAMSDMCEFRDGVDEAMQSCHRIATHGRATFSMKSLAEGAKYITIHEDPRGFLCPTTEASGGFQSVATAVREAIGKVWAKPDQTLRFALQQIENVAHMLAEQVATAETTHVISVPEPIISPPRLDALLFDALTASEAEVGAEALKICRAITAGDAEEVVVRVDRMIGKDRKEVIRRMIVVVQRTKLPDDVTIWLSDATADPAEIEALAGRPIANRTPPGLIQLQHDVVQLPVDIKKGTSRTTVLKTVRGILAQYPDARRIGIICDQKHVAAIRGSARKGEVLDEYLRTRIVMVSHFRSAESRGSNEWVEQCDLLIVLGTPRVPPAVAANSLIAAGKAAAAARDGKWGPDWWSGRDRSGRRQTIRSLAYADHDWHAAHRSDVRAELIQAVGRARSICEQGIPAAVVTTEDLGLALADWAFVAVKAGMMEVLKAIRSLMANYQTGDCPPEAVAKSGNPYLYKIENTGLSCHQLVVPASPSAIALTSGKSISQVHSVLKDLADAGFVKHIGNRGGWILTDSGRSLLSPFPVLKAPEVPL